MVTSKVRARGSKEKSVSPSILNATISEPEPVASTRDVGRGAAVSLREEVDKVFEFAAEVWQTSLYTKF